MLIDSVALHDELAPIVEKLELLTRLSPVLETDQEFARTMTIVMQIISDYVAQLRRTLEALGRATPRKGAAHEPHARCPEPG